MAEQQETEPAAWMYEHAPFGSRIYLERQDIADFLPGTIETPLYINAATSLADQQETDTPGGTKHDDGKAKLSLLPSDPLIEIARVLEFGAKKYARHNWRGGMAWSRPTDAALRHIFAFNEGEDTDPESGLSHIDHAICSLMFLREFQRTHPELDDRFKRPRKDA